MKWILFFSLTVGSQAFAANCANDAQKFCSGVELGAGRVANCLAEFKDQLDPACAKELNLHVNNTSKKIPCYMDYADFCANIPSEPQKRDLCLLKHETRLSPVCAKDFKTKKPALIVKNECAQDIVNVCYPEVAGVEGAINHCLIKNRAKLSRFCQVNIDGKIAKLRKGNPCYDDTMKNCPNAVKVIDIQECLEKKIPTLAPTCQKVVQHEQKKALKNPCYKDLVRHCRPNISPAEQVRCLVVNNRELSSACKHFRVQESAKLEKMVKDCENDRVKFCAKEPIRDGKVVKCLRKNKASVSPACKALL
jgi:hypothetical protein